MPAKRMGLDVSPLRGIEPVGVAARKPVGLAVEFAGDPRSFEEDALLLQLRG